MASPVIGKVFQERYMVLSQLGAGGMGTVFHARQIDADREVALKIPNIEELTNAEVLARFAREFKLLARLSNPHIMNVYGVALDSDSVPFAICEFLEGNTLRKVLSEGKIESSRALKISLQICIAMQEAHSQGVLHRDLKPDNVFLLDKPEPDFVKVIDFGLATIFANMSESQKITKSGKLVGSPFYMSPEMIQNKNIDGRADIYSFGCILFEMLSGEKLFDANSMPEVVYLHCVEDPISRLESLSHFVSPSMIAVMKKLLAKDPDLRYQTMNDVSIAITEQLHGSKSGPLPVLPNKKYLPWIAASLVLLVITGISVASLSMKSTRNHSEPEKTASSPKRTHQVKINSIICSLPVSWTLHSLEGSERLYMVSGSQSWAQFAVSVFPSLGKGLEEAKANYLDLNRKKGWKVLKDEASSVANVKSCEFIHEYRFAKSKSFLDAVQSGDSYGVGSFNPSDKNTADLEDPKTSYVRVERLVLFKYRNELYYLSINSPKDEFPELSNQFDQVMKTLQLR